MASRQFEPGRAVEVISPTYGSAYRIGGRLVLTAAHLVAEVGSICRVRSKQGFGETEAKVVWKASKPADIALVALDGSIEPCEAVVLGRLPEARSGERLVFQMYGYPLWGRTHREQDKTAAGGRQIEGVIYLADTSPDSLLVLEAERVPPEGLSDKGSGWVGASGAAIVCDGLVVAVQSQHQNPLRPASLEASPLWTNCSDEKWNDLLNRHGISPELVTAQLQATGTTSQISEAKKIIATEFQVPYLRNDYFTGRSQLLQDLHAEFTRTGVAAIAGLGGIGKTQTAVEYAYRHFPVDYDWVFWVKAETELSAVTDLATIGRSLSLAGATLDELAMQVRQWLETHDRWLVIFDNADQPELLKSVLPRRRHGRILLTSRAQRFVSVGIKAPLEMGKLSLEESIAFLSDRTQRLELDAAELAAVEALARELDGLPLALEQAGAYLDQVQVRFAVYLAHYRQQRVALLEWQKPETGDYLKSVATTWELNFKEVARRSPLAVQILQVSAVLAADDIPEALLQQSQLGLTGKSSWVKTQLGKLLKLKRRDSVDELMLAEGLAALANFSLIQRDGGVYSIHRMVQEVVWQGLAVAVRKDWLERAIATLNAMFPDVTKFENWQVCGLLVSHVQAIAARLEVNPVDAPEVGLLLNQAGYYLHQQGRYSEAEPLYKQSLSIREQQLGADHPDVALSINNLAGLYESQGRYSEAEPLYKRSLSIREQQPGADHPDVAQSLNNLAYLYYSQGRYGEAEPLYKHSLSIWEQQLGADHPHVAASLNNLALLYNSQGRYSEAEPLYVQAITIFWQRLGKGHPNTETALSNFYSCLRKAIEAEQGSQLSDHPVTQTLLQQLQAP